MTRNTSRGGAREGATRRVRREQQSRSADPTVPRRRTTKTGWPEWYTEQWKRDVEAEARKRLKRGIGGLGGTR